ncbi:serine/threonine protein phosphatase [Sphingomonadaceae bacterium jetA1]|jgi:hypothetical protein|uniref:serine/threonine protein phosphatase n=1 Tax=Facivitalis istanbulensis TaxID=3075838 RepID=UPI0034708138
MALLSKGARQALALIALTMPGTASTRAAQPGGGDAPLTFRIAVIPDTQHYLDYRKQTGAGYPFDGVALFYDQMRFIADHSVAAGGDIAFATAVGDVWEHQSLPVDPDNTAKGIHAIDNPKLRGILEATPRTRTVEMPAARRGYAMLAGKLPFSVVPGNHDYDAQFTSAKFPPTTDPAMKRAATPAYYGMLHVGGLRNFTSVFGADTPFFRGKPWYVASYRGGADSAQIFTAGGYRFLHIGLEFAAPDDALDWAARVMARHPGLPTIVTTHDFLNSDGSRTPNPVVDMKAVDPANNNPEDVWRKFIRRHDQIFLVLSGHERGQAYRVDANAFGHPVYQMMADYQDRNASYRNTSGDGSSTTARPTGDGWLRMLSFDMRPASPVIRVRTYSTYYKAYSTQVPAYAAWYKADDAPRASAADYRAKDDFTVTLTGFRQRFAKGAARKPSLN